MDRLKPSVLAALPEKELLEAVQRRTFRYFWEGAHPTSGLARDRLETGGAASDDLVAIGGSGFGVMTLLVAVERGWVERDAAAERLNRMLEAMGRYAHDRYYSGGAYYFSTLGAAEFYFRAGVGTADPARLIDRGDAFLNTVRAFTPRSVCRSSSTRPPANSAPRRILPGVMRPSSRASPPAKRRRSICSAAMRCHALRDGATSRIGISCREVTGHGLKL